MSKMPRYFLHLYADEISTDRDGIERPTADHARSAAVRGARDIIAADIMSGKPIHLTHWIEVTDEQGEVLHVVQFGDLVQLVP